MKHRKIIGLLFLLGACSINGCSDSGTLEKEVEKTIEKTPLDSGQAELPIVVPKTFVEAVTQISSLNQKIKIALAEDDIKTADGPVHQLGHILEDVNEMAQEEGLAEGDIEEIKAAVETLFKTFGEVDERIHTGSGKRYSDVETEISQAIKTLEDKSAIVSSKQESLEKSSLKEDGLEEEDQK